MVYLFQSPDGDFVYSDYGVCFLSARWHEKFQSPDGDFVYSDTVRPATSCPWIATVSIP